MIADAHLHLFRHGFRRDGSPEGTDVADYEALRARHRIGAGLVIGYEAEGIDPENNSYLRDLAATRRWMVTLAYLPVTPAPTEEYIATLLDAGHSGLAVYLPDATSGLSVAAWPDAVWRILNARCAIVSLNARPEAILALSPVMEHLTEAVVLLSHLGLPGAVSDVPSRADALARLAPLVSLARFAQVSVKLSGLYAVDSTPPHRGAWPFVDLILDRFGPARCLWGSDFPPALEAGTFCVTPDGPVSMLSGPDRELVMGGALADILGRVDPSSKPGHPEPQS